MLSNLLHYIDAQEPIPTELMLAALHDLDNGFGAKRRREAANAILPGAGDYLPDLYHLRAFITAELSDENAKKLISARKAHIERARQMLPTIFSLLSVQEEGHIYTALRMIEDCCHDFPIILSSSHSKKVRKKILKDLDDVRNTTSRLQGLLEDVGKHVDIEYDHHKAAIARTEGHDVEHLHEFNQLRTDLNHLKFAADLALYRDAIGEDAFYVGDNKARTHVVEYAYDLAISREAPPFVTTPGSDFSLLCSLIYELASGEQDHSLAGAINKFARSELRERLDRFEAETRWQNCDKYAEAREADNFAHITEEVASLSEKYEFWKEMSSSCAWDDATKAQLATRALDTRKQIEKAQRQNGPFLVWASQYSRGDLDRHRNSFEEIEGKLLTLEIKLGKLRRQTGCS